MDTTCIVVECKIVIVKNRLITCKSIIYLYIYILYYILYIYYTILYYIILIYIIFVKHLGKFLQWIQKYSLFHTYTKIFRFDSILNFIKIFPTRIYLSVERKIRNRKICLFQRLTKREGESKLGGMMPRSWSRSITGPAGVGRWTEEEGRTVGGEAPLATRTRAGGGGEWACWAYCVEIGHYGCRWCSISACCSTYAPITAPPGPGSRSRRPTGRRRCNRRRSAASRLWTAPRGAPPPRQLCPRPRRARARAPATPPAR